MEKTELDQLKVQLQKEVLYHRRKSLQKQIARLEQEGKVKTTVPPTQTLF